MSQKQAKRIRKLEQTTRQLQNTTQTLIDHDTQNTISIQNIKAEMVNIGSLPPISHTISKHLKPDANRKKWDEALTGLSLGCMGLMIVWLIVASIQMLCT